MLVRGLSLNIDVSEVFPSPNFILKSRFRKVNKRRIRSKCAFHSHFFEQEVTLGVLIANSE